MKKMNWFWAFFALCFTLVNVSMTAHADDQTPADQFRVGMEAGYAPSTGPKPPMPMERYLFLARKGLPMLAVMTFKSRRKSLMVLAKN